MADKVAAASRRSGGPSDVLEEAFRHGEETVLEALRRSSDRLADWSRKGPLKDLTGCRYLNIGRQLMTTAEECLQLEGMRMALMVQRDLGPKTELDARMSKGLKGDEEEDESNVSDENGG